MRFLKILILVLFAGSLNSCKSRNAGNDNSDVKLAGAVDMGRQDESFPVMQYSVKHKGAYLFCTGVFVLPNVVLTAAHCLVNKESEGIFDKSLIVVNSHFLKVERLMLDLDFLNLKLTATERDKHDLAAIFVSTIGFGKAFWAENINPILSVKKLKEGDQIKIIGYGLTAPDAPSVAWTPRQGYNNVSSVDESYIEFQSENYSRIGGDVSNPGGATDSITMGGDSGGPVYYHDHLAGIVVSGAAGVGVSGTSVINARSRAINLAGPIGQKFIAKLHALR